LRFETVKEVNVRNMVFWDVTLYSLLYPRGLLTGLCGCKFLQNIFIYLPQYMVSHQKT